MCLHTGTVKGLTSEQMQELDCHVILGNTYHLANRPGGELVAAMGGLHGFSNWPRGMLTDSGGFQMVSLLHLADITEEGMFLFYAAIGGETFLVMSQHKCCCLFRIHVSSWFNPTPTAAWAAVSAPQAAEVSAWT